MQTAHHPEARIQAWYDKVSTQAEVRVSAVNMLG